MRLLFVARADRALLGLVVLLGLLILAVPVSGQQADTDQFTPVVASPLTSSIRAFLGTDGKYHLVYELVVTNSRPTPATLKTIEVLDAGKPSAVIASYDGEHLLSRLHMMSNAPAGKPEIEFNGTRLFLIDVAFDTRAQVPTRLLHRFTLLGSATPAPASATPVMLSYTLAPLDISSKQIEIGPPLAGKGWVALNGCCDIGGAHRATGLPVNGGVYFAQRFAIDWMRLDDAGHLVKGDPADVHNYADYGADVLAVADGTVVSTLNTLEDQVPGKMPDPATITLANVDGNHVVLDLGGGVFAFYAHMRKGSVTVAPGQRVKRGQVLGKVGNTGNTSAPHLHFHLMEGPSVLGSNGIPYGVDHFSLAGRPKDVAAANDAVLERSWKNDLFPAASVRQGQFPLDLDIVDF
ncbi:MAG: M23 family metallopeptidase [Acidobacteriaceae bacterium]